MAQRGWVTLDAITTMNQWVTSWPWVLQESNSLFSNIPWALKRLFSRQDKSFRPTYEELTSLMTRINKPTCKLYMIKLALTEKDEETNYDS